MSSSPVSESGALAALATVLGVVWLWHVPRKKICQSTFWSTIVSCLPPVFSTKITNVTIFELPCAEGWETRTQDSAELPRKQIEPIQSGGNFWGSQIQIQKKTVAWGTLQNRALLGNLATFAMKLVTMMTLKGWHAHLGYVNLKDSTCPQSQAYHLWIIANGWPSHMAPTCAPLVRPQWESRKFFNPMLRP